MPLYRVKLISPLFGVDEGCPLHPHIDHARRAAHLMVAFYGGRVRAEIHRMTDLRLRRSECLETIGPWPDGKPPEAPAR